MALTAAQATYKCPPLGLMLPLWLMGVMVRLCCLVAPNIAFGLGESAFGDAAALAHEASRLHTDNHVSVYTFVTFIAHALGAQTQLLRAVSLGCDAAMGLLWLVWLRARNVGAADIFAGLWASSPVLIQTATATGPHAALGLWTTAGLLALWPVWQKQRPTTQDKLGLLGAWALLVCAHPLGILAVVAMVLTALSWPKASAAALANTLSTTAGQAGRVARNIVQPALVATGMYGAMRLLGHIYPSPDAGTGVPLRLTFDHVADVVAEGFGTDMTLAFGTAAVQLPMPAAVAVGLYLVLMLAGISHPIGRRLICMAALYTAGLVAYHSVLPVFAAPTLLPAWIFMLGGGALGLGAARMQGAVRGATAVVCLWQLAVWQAHCVLWQLPF